MSKKKNVLGNVLLLFSAVAWGLAFSAQKSASAHLPPFSVNLIRFLLGGLILIPFILILDRVTKNGRRLFCASLKRPFDITRTELVGGVLCGCALMLATTLQQISISAAHILPGKASFLTAMYIVFVPIYGLIRRKIAASNAWVSVVFALFGAYLLTADELGNFAIGAYDVVLFISAAMFALHITIIDVFAPRVDGARMSMVQFFTVALINIPFAIFWDTPVTQESFGAACLAALPALLYLGILSCGLAYTAQILGQQLSGLPTVASLIMSLESVFGLIGGVLFLEESMNGSQIAGCAVILAAVVFSQLPLKDWIAKLRNKKQDI